LNCFVWFIPFYFVEFTIVRVPDWAKAQYTWPKRSRSSPNSFLYEGFLHKSMVTYAIITTHLLQLMHSVIRPWAARFISTALIIYNTNCNQLSQTVIIVSPHIKTSFGAKVHDSTTFHFHFSLLTYWLERLSTTWDIFPTMNHCNVHEVYYHCNCLKSHHQSLRVLLNAD
jgi:hypothetical protein